MGAGKTVFSAGIGQGWGAIHPLTSPTFNLVHEHRREADTLRLYHLDCYRLNGVEDVESIGLDDILNGRSVVIMEWPERILGVLPQRRLWVQLRILEASRRNLIFEGEGDRYRQLIERFRQITYGV
jgi:tRNA threonylcarbamoyladenosine biosynthesis protein TsaE